MKKHLYYILINSLRCIYTLKTDDLPIKPVAIESNKELLGQDLYEKIRQYQSGKTKQFEINPDVLEDIVDYGISLY